MELVNTNPPDPNSTFSSKSNIGYYVYEYREEDEEDDTGKFLNMKQAKILILIYI